MCWIYLDFERLDSCGVERTSSESEVSQLDMSRTIYEEVLQSPSVPIHPISINPIAYLRLEIPMNITKLMQLVHSHEHLRDIKPCIFLLEDPAVVHQGTEITTGDVFHREVDVCGVLECVEEADEPGCSCCCEDVYFYEYVSDLPSI